MMVSAGGGEICYRLQFLQLDGATVKTNVTGYQAAWTIFHQSTHKALLQLSIGRLVHSIPHCPHIVMICPAPCHLKP